MDAFPAFFPLTGKRIAIVGAGEQAEAKLRLFEGSPAEVVRIPAGPEALETGAYAGVLIAFIAAPDDAFGEGCAAAARAAGALVNVIDRPHLSDFTMPAIVDRGTVVAVMAQDKSERNAEAIVHMAVQRRGVADSIYGAVPAGSYTVGDEWHGSDHAG